MANLEWLMEFPKMVVVNLPTLKSYHSFIILNCDYKDKKAVRRFKFEVVWLTLDECENIIKEEWNRRFGGIKLHQIIQKLSNCRRLLVEWSKKSVPNNGKLIMELTKEAEVL